MSKIDLIKQKPQYKDSGTRMWAFVHKHRIAPEDKIVFLKEYIQCFFSKEEAITEWEANIQDDCVEIVEVDIYELK